MADQNQVCDLTTIYNGRCGVCRPEIEHYARLDAKEGGRHRWVNLYEAPDLLARYGLDAETVKRRLHVIGPGDRPYAGVDAFLLIWRAIPRYRWLAALVGSRPVKPLADAVYDRVLAPALYALTRRRERREAAGRALPERGGA